MKAIMLFILSVAMCIGYTSCKKDNSVKPSAAQDTGTGNSIRTDEEGIFIKGHVKNTSGSAISGATVSIIPYGSVLPVQSTTTDAAGAYALTEVESGSYVLRLSASGYMSRSIVISVSGNIDRTDTLVAN
jgi:hypothetical protein